MKRVALIATVGAVAGTAMEDFRLLGGLGQLLAGLTLAAAGLCVLATGVTGALRAALAGLGRGRDHLNLSALARARALLRARALAALTGGRDHLNLGTLARARALLRAGALAAFAGRNQGGGGLAFGLQGAARLAFAGDSCGAHLGAGDGACSTPDIPDSARPSLVPRRSWPSSRHPLKIRTERQPTHAPADLRTRRAFVPLS